MNYHEQTIELIATLGIKPKKIAEILGKSTSLVYNKMKSTQYHRFNRNDFNAISEHIKKNTPI